MAVRQLPDRFRSSSDADWFRLIRASASKPEIDGFQFPRFPPAAIQERFTGQSGEHALQSAYRLYVFFKSQLQSLGCPLARESRCLDFGCGWGRFLRFLWKDVDADNLFGCDTSRPLVELCESLGVPGDLIAVESRGRLPYPDGFFNGVLAHSMFTHLSEPLHLHWIQELARVCKPGAVVCLALESRRFLDRVASMNATARTPGDRVLLRSQPSIAAHAADYAARGFAFLPSVPDGLETDGHAVCSAAFVTRNWGHAFDLKTYIDHASQMSQALVVVQRRA
jgi:SAM-dependent methyltransferase